MRRQLAYCVCLSAALIGLGCTAFLYRYARDVEEERIEHITELRVEWRAKVIEHRLRDVSAPLSALALFLGSQSEPTESQFNVLAAATEALVRPVGRLSWAPRVNGVDRDRFEMAARQAGDEDYTIKTVDTDGKSIPEPLKDEYFPIRFERLVVDSPTAMGFDLGAEASRRQAIELARDLGEPVARQGDVAGRPIGAVTVVLTSVIYWPVFAGGTIPKTLGERRALVAGYITLVMRTADLLTYVISDTPDIPETILFQQPNNVAGDGPHTVAFYTNAMGLLVGQPSPLSAEPEAAFLRRGFTVLHQTWLLEFSFPKTYIDGIRSFAPLTTAALGLFVTIGITGTLLILVRRSEADRTARLAATAQMQVQERANMVLESLNERLAQREQATAEALKDRTRFIALASHDLRQPLHALALFASALDRRVTDKVGLEIVGNIQNVIVGMQRMFTSLLDLGRLDTGAIAPKISVHRIDRLIGNLRREFEIEAKEKHLQLRQFGSFPAVETDISLLEAVLRNLLNNAIKFTDKGGVLIAGRKRQGRLHIEIWDTGIGIAQNQIDVAFREFERLDDVRNRPGFGLGLSIVRRLCTLIDAPLDVCSRPKQGSRFSISLPLAYVAEAGDPGAAVASMQTVHGRRIVVVDNDAMVRQALVLELRDWGCAVQCAETGDQALSLIRSDGAPDLVVLDIALGAAQRDGWAIADEIRHLHPGQPILLITGSTDAATLERIQASELPAMFKPIELGSLLRTILDLVKPDQNPA